MAAAQKIQEWALRYGPPEIAGIFVVLLASHLVVSLTGSQILAAFVAPWCENSVYYSIIGIRDARTHGTALGVPQYFRLLRNMLAEFGPAEYIDSLFIRPACLAFFPTIVSPYALAIFIGDMVANITYYIPVVLSYELQKKLWKH